MVELEDNNLKTILGVCHIYQNHIRTIDGKIYMHSLCFDDGIMVLGKSSSFLPVKEQAMQIEKLSTDLSTAEFFDRNNIEVRAHMYNNRTVSCIQMNDVVFHYPYHPGRPFGHQLLYGYNYFYYYLLLRDKHPDIKLIVPYGSDDNVYWSYLKTTLDIKSIIYLKEDETILNEGTTYCVYQQFPEVFYFRKNLVDFYSDFADTALKKYTTKTGTSTNIYPKKLLFLRKSTNIAPNSKRLLQNRQDVVQLCERYGYVDIDQTLYEMDEVIYLMNNATHIVTEIGGGIIHLLWTKQIKVICLAWSYEPWNLCASYYLNGCDYVQKLTNNRLESILRHKDAKVIHNIDPLLDKILTGQYWIPWPHTHSKLPVPSMFTNMTELEKAIIDNNH
jgi:hypothetical protein